MATTISPLKILSDLGMNPWEIENDEDYLRALKEGIITIEAASKGKGDRRSEILREELIRVRKERKASPPTSEVGAKEKKTTIKAAKLLPGTATTKPDDLKQAQINESGEDKSKLLQSDILNDIAKSVESIAILLRRQFKLETKQQRDARIKQDKDTKDAREDDLEKKPDKKTGGLPKAIAKPAIGFFDRIKKFFFNIGIGAALYKMHAWITDPANAEKIGKFKDFLVDNAPLILGGLAALALLPVVGGLVGMIGGIMGGLSMLGLAVPLLPIILKGMLIAAVIALTVAAGNAIKNKLTQSISGGGAFKELDDRAEKKLREAGLGKVTNIGAGKHSAQLLGPDGKPIRVKMWEGDTGAAGDDKWGSLMGRPWSPGDKGKNTSDDLTIGNPLHEAYIERTMGKEKLEEYKSAMNLYNRVIFEEKDPIKDKMHKEIDDEARKIRFDRAGDSPEHQGWFGDNTEYNAYQKETRELILKNEEEIREKYDKIIMEKFPEYFGKIDSSANINKDVKPNTDVPGPSTKNKAGNLVLAGGGGGNQQQVSSSGGGGGGSSSIPKFSSQDPNNVSTVSTGSMYNIGSV